MLHPILSVAARDKEIHGILSHQPYTVCAVHTDIHMYTYVHNIDVLVVLMTDVVGTLKANWTIRAKGTNIQGCT